MKIILCLLLLLCVIDGSSQTVFRKQSLKIGDPLSDISLSIDSKNSKLKFSDLQGKLVILDFWGINCGPCIKAFPKLEELQYQFHDKIQIILVNSESKYWIDSVVKLRQKYIPNFKLSSLQSIYGDSIFNKLFPHQILPHYVWIDTDGTFIGTTGSDEITEMNITSRLLKKPTPMTMKKDLLEFEHQKPILPQLLKIEENSLIHYSSLQKFVPGLWGGTTRIFIDSSASVMRISRSNYSILELYGDALTHFKCGNPYESPLFDFGKRVMLEASDSTKYFPPIGNITGLQQWNRKYRYCFEMVMATEPENVAYENYRLELNKFFRLNGRIEKRKMRCLVLVRINHQDLIKYKGADGIGQACTDSAGTFHLLGLGRGLSVFRNELSRANKTIPYLFVDGTGYLNKVELHITSQLNDIASLKNELRKKYALDLVEKELEIETMVISEIKEGNLNKMLPSFLN